MSPVARLLERLEGVKRSGDGWTARCPAHEDRRASLSVGEGDDGCALVKCHAGCSPGDVATALGLTLGDLFEKSSVGNDVRRNCRRVVATYPYVDEEGRLLFEAVRFEPKGFAQRRPDGNGGWTWTLGDARRVVYRLPRVLEAARSGGTVYVVEGEKDVEALERLGLVATCNPMGAGKWRPDFAAAFAGCRRVVVLPDDDEQGRAHAADVARSLVGVADDVRVVELLPRGESKADVSDWLAPARTEEARASARRLLGEIVERTPAFVTDVPAVRDSAGNPASGAGSGKGGQAGDNAPTPYALTFDEFIAAESETPPALLGSATDVVIPTAGLVILAGKPGSGKTTLAVDGAFHLASGVEWLGLPVERPLRVLFVENEGPREPFRRKLELKRRTWPHEVQGELFVYAQRWGGASFVESDGFERLRAFVDAEAIDLVIGDPLSSLGPAGVGSPADVRDFVGVLREHGLFERVAFWFLHHFVHGSSRNGAKAAENEIDELAGSWGGYPDAILVVKELEGDRLRLSLPKLRWAAEARRPLILARLREQAGFEVVAEEGAAGERDIEAEVLELLAADGEWRTLSEIAKSKAKGGVGRNREDVRAVLEELVRAGELEYAVGPDGRAADAKCWRVAQPSEQPRATPLFGEGSGRVAQPPDYPVRGRGLDNPPAQGLLPAESSDHEQAASA